MTSALAVLAAAAATLCPTAHPGGAGHVGSVVVFVHYIPPYEGEPRAAILLENPRACPPGTPAGLDGCANLRFWTVQGNAGGLFEGENPTLLLDAEQLPVQEGWHVNAGDDWRLGVPHDPTGIAGRSWHVWGEALCEEPDPAQACP